MNRSLDSVLDSVLASINLDNSSSSDEVLVTPVNTRGILFADQVELSHRPLLSAEVTRYNNLLVGDNNLEAQSNELLMARDLSGLEFTAAAGVSSGGGGRRTASSPQIVGGGRDVNSMYAVDDDVYLEVQSSGFGAHEKDELEISAAGGVSSGRGGRRAVSSPQRGAAVRGVGGTRDLLNTMYFDDDSESVDENLLGGGGVNSGQFSDSLYVNAMSQGNDLVMSNVLSASKFQGG